MVVLRLFFAAFFLATALATDPGNVSAQPDAGSFVQTDGGTSSEKTSRAPERSPGIVCVTPYMPIMSTLLQSEGRLKFARHYLTECQKCPDAWSKCEPCDSASVVEAALALARHLRYLANGKAYQQSEFEEVMDFLTGLRLPSHPHRSDPMKHSIVRADCCPSHYVCRRNERGLPKGVSAIS